METADRMIARDPDSPTSAMANHGLPCRDESRGRLAAVPDASRYSESEALRSRAICSGYDNEVTRPRSSGVSDVPETPVDSSAAVPLWPATSPPLRVPLPVLSTSLSEANSRAVDANRLQS